MPKRKHNSVVDDDTVKAKRKPVALRQDTNSDDDDNNDIDASQRPDFYDNATMGEEAEVGIIEQVVIKNFMNHTIQDIRFGPQVNFVIGPNGSGKSAVLTGIAVGLGGKAIITNRGSAIKGFIKEGKSSAEVMIKLRNRGQDAFRPEMYGSSIIVERRITKESSSYKLKSSTGKLVSTKREELSHILEHFNIQVENPIVVLNQETSRNFLHSKSPHDKYKFFLKATQLEQMKQDYINANESKEIAEDMLQRKKQTLPSLEKDVFEWEQKYKALSSLNDLKAKMDRLREEFIWALISEREKGLEPTAKELKTEEARTPKFDHKVEESEHELKASQGRHSAIEKELTALGSRVEGIEPQYREARREKEDKKKHAKITCQEAKKLQKDIGSNQRDKESILARILEIQNSAQQDFDSEHEARKSKIGQLEGQVQDYQAKKRSTEHELDQFRSAVQRLKKDEMQAKSEQEEVNRRVTEMKRHLQTLRDSRNNRLRRFGAFMPQLIQKIDEANNRGVFHRKPIGPLGAHFSLKDQRWALAVETCLKSLIFAFCVHDHHDERELEKIMKSACPPGRNPATITSVFQSQVYNVSRNRPLTRKYQTVLEVLKIENPIVANCLIDQRGVESVLLFEDIKESRDVMADKPPQGSREAFNIEGDQIHCNPFRYYSSSEDKVKILVQSVEEDIKRCQHDLLSLDVTLGQKQDQLNTVKREFVAQNQEERKAQKRVMHLQQQLGKVQMELNELYNIEEPTPVDVKTLEEEVTQLDDMITKLQEQLVFRQETHNQANVDFIESDKRFHLLDTEMSTISEQTDSIKDQLALLENAMQTARSHKQHYEAKRKEHEKKISDLKKKYEKYKAELEEERARAEQACARVKSKRSSQNLESEIKQIGKQITAEEKIRGNHDEITRRYHEIRESFMSIRSEVNQLTSFLKALHKVMTSRQGQYTIFRRMIATRAKFFFIVMLGTRKYSGKMIFDHKKELLELNVMPSSESAEVNKDMRSLSGGERSFATVCFILSLWDAMESPFRCLDEFDVFMDMVNRRISMDMMMSVAQTQKGRQFIFITPQNMSHVTIDASMVKIFQMRAPERGQRALPYRPIDRNGTHEDEDDDDMNAVTDDR